MEVVCRAFHAAPGRRGLVVGILPSRNEDPALPKRGYPNRWVELAIATHLPLTGERGSEAMSRNHINVLSCDAVIALPGGAGTSSEVQLARRYQRPVAAYIDRRSDIPGLPAEVAVFLDLAGIRQFVHRALHRA
jgi:predicted Rossmann-fold nucleotide-binding protein